jgi:putative tricarboxylic transport membrane protein
MSVLNRRHFTQMMLAGAAVSAVGINLAHAAIEGLEFLAPSAPGSGYDQLARTIQASLQAENLASGMQVANVPGGGGTVGLAQYINTKKSHPSLLVFGFALVGGIIVTKSSVTLDQVTPIARLMSESNVIVVAANSPIKTLADLVAKMKADPGSVSWAGGSIGGIDHVMVALIAKEVGVDPTKANYVVHAGGGEVMASVLGGHATAGVSGYEEFRSQIEGGQLRALALSSAQRRAGVDVPTLKEGGVNLEVVNWRGLATQSTASEADRKALSDAIAAMVKSASWKDALAKKGWLDFYQPAEQFGAFLKSEQTRVAAVAKELGLVK